MAKLFERFLGAGGAKCASHFEEQIKMQENESRSSLELQILKCAPSVVTKPHPSGDELETAVSLKTHACLHLSMVHITVVAQSNWTHSESRTRTQHGIKSGRCVPGLLLKLLPTNSRASCLFQRSRVNIIGVRGRVAPLLQMENMSANVATMLSRVIL